MPENSARTAHAIVNRAITTNPDYVCGCSLCRNSKERRPEPSEAQSKPFRCTGSALAKDQTGKSYAWLTPIDGVAVKVIGRKAEQVLAICKAIEALEVKR